jgi:hypothetical protein
MAGKVDIQVAIGADATPLEKEVAKARGSVHGLARDVEGASKSMSLGAVAGRPGVRPSGAPVPTIPSEVLTGTRRNVEAMAGAATKLGTSAAHAADKMERASKVTRGPSVPAGGYAATGKSIAAQMVRRPEFNFMGRMEGLLGGFTLGGLMMWIRGAEQAATKSKELARAARLPTEEFVRLQKAAKDNQIPVEVLNDALEDYAEGKITLQQVGEAVGIIGMKAGGATDDVKKLANQIDELAALDKQMTIVQEGASNLGKSVTVGLSNVFSRVSRMAIESVYQGRAVDWWEAGEMMDESRTQEKREEVKKMEDALKEKRIMIKVQADLDEFFGDLERRAAKEAKIKVRLEALKEQLDERVARITVKAPGAGDSLARIGGYMGGRMDNRGLMIAERQLRVAEENAEYTKQVAKALTEG